MLHLVNGDCTGVQGTSLFMIKAVFPYPVLSPQDPPTQGRHSEKNLSFPHPRVALSHE